MQRFVWIKTKPDTCSLRGLPFGMYFVTAFNLLRPNSEPTRLQCETHDIEFVAPEHGQYLLTCATETGDEIANTVVTLTPESNKRFSVELSRQVVVEKGISSHDYRIKIIAANALNMPCEIFLFKRLFDGVRHSDELVTVCKPGDLEEFPVCSPHKGQNFFRMSVIDTVERSSRMAEKLWDSVSSETRVLIDALNRNRTLFTDVTQLLD